MSDPVKDFKIESWTLFGCGTIIVIVRLIARWRAVGIRHFAADDYLMILAIV